MDSGKWREDSRPGRDLKTHGMTWWQVLRFPSCLTLGTGEAGNLEMPTGTDTKGLQAKPALSSQRTRKGAADQDRKLLGSQRLLGKKCHKLGYSKT